MRIIGLVENIDERKALELKVKKAQQQVYDAINNIEGAREKKNGKTETSSLLNRITFGVFN